MTKTQIIKLDAANSWHDKALNLLRAGEIIAVPTETVYGLAGDATREDAIASIYTAKGRPSNNPLIIHVADMEMAERYAELTDEARTLVEAFWPGPLTLVLPLKANTGLAKAVTAGGDSLALRCPQGALRELAAAIGTPLAAPSANRSGHVSATSAEHVLNDLDGRISLILDGGSSMVGVESTIVDLRETPRILRPGALTAHDLSTALGRTIIVADSAEDESPVAPGQLTSHYAPSVPVRLNVLPQEVRSNEAYLGFGANSLKGHENLSADGDVNQAATRLYAALRAHDRTDVTGIAIAPLPQEGLGEALANRLQRASAPKG